MTFLLFWIFYCAPNFICQLLWSVQSLSKIVLLIFKNLNFSLCFSLDLYLDSDFLKLKLCTYVHVLFLCIGKMEVFKNSVITFLTINKMYSTLPGITDQEEDSPWHLGTHSLVTVTSHAYINVKQNRWQYILS